MVVQYCCLAVCPQDTAVGDVSECSPHDCYVALDIHFRVSFQTLERTCCYEADVVGVECHQGDRQFSEVEFQGPSNGVDVHVGPM